MVEGQTTLSHLVLQQRKTLCARLIVLEETIAQEDQTKANEHSRLRLLREHLLSAATSPTRDRSPDFERLDHTLRELSAKVPMIEAFRATPPDATRAFIPLSQRLRDRLDHVDCASCATAAGRPICIGCLNDDEVVARAGHCLLPLRTLFELAVEQTRAMYSSVSEATPVHDVEVIWASAPLTQPVSFDHAPEILGITETRVEKSIVVTFVRADKYDRGSYLATAYTLLHECICHAFQGARDLASRSATDQDDEFAEGWMDFLTLKTLESLHLERVAGPNGRTLSAREKYAGRDLHGERLNPESVKTDRRTENEIEEERTRRSAHWNGVDAAEKFSLSLGWDAYRRVSLDANLEAGINGERRAFVASIQRLLTEPVDKSDVEEVHREYSNYMQYKDIRRFIRAFS
jgi:hypothetical protein